MARKYWEEMGYSTEWYYDQMRMRCNTNNDRLDDAELTRIIRKHGGLARAELAMLAGSGNYNCYTGALDRINAALARRSPFVSPAWSCDQPMQADFFI